MFIFNEQLRSQYSYDDTMKNGVLKLVLFLHADTLMLYWCIDSTTQTEFGRPFGTMLQVKPTTIANREYCEKKVHPYKSWGPGHGKG